MLLGTHKSQTLALPRSHKTWMKYGALLPIMITFVYDGLHRKSWMIGGYIARKQTSSHSQGLQSRCVADNLPGPMNNKVSPILTKAFTGAPPFNDTSPHAAALAITSGERPPRPAHPGLTENLWALIQQCWNQEAHLRPHALRVSSYL